MFSTFDLRLLLYVIRLAGWLKHCNLSLSLSHLIGALRRRMSSCKITKFLESSEVLGIRRVCSERYTAPPGSSAEGADTALFLESHFCLQADLMPCE